jgi:hypothetical protein
MKGLITRIYRELIKLNSPKINEPIRKLATELNRSFLNEEVQMAKSHKGNANQNNTRIPPHSC